MNRRYSTQHADRIILDYLETEVSAFRTDLEELVVRAGHSATLCTRRLEALREEPAVLRYALRNPNNGKDTHLYAIRKLTNEEVESRYNLMLDRQSLLKDSKLGLTCEKYARYLFRRARDGGAAWLEHIPNKQKLGIDPITNDRKADLLVKLNDSLAYQHAALIECKNQRTQFTLSSRIFAKLMKTALRTKALPVLVTAHIAGRAEQFCHDAGIAVLHLTKQLIPTTQRQKARWLWGKERADRIFHAIREDRPFADPNRTPELQMAHLLTVSDEEWLLTASARWHRNLRALPALIDALESKHWKRFNSLYSAGYALVG